MALLTSWIVIEGRRIGSAYSYPSVSSKSAAGGIGKKACCRSSTFLASCCSMVPSGLASGGMCTCWCCLFRAYFTSFHNPSGDVDAFCIRGTGEMYVEVGVSRHTLLSTALPEDADREPRDVTG